jgi:hypothetical protein
LRSTLDGNSRFEGYSGEVPKDVLIALNAARLLPDSRALTALRADGLRYIVLHGGPVPCSGELAPDELAALESRLRSMTDQVANVIVAGTDRVVVLHPWSASTTNPNLVAALPQAPLVNRPLCYPGGHTG